MRRLLLFLALSSAAFSQPVIINQVQAAGQNTFTTSPINAVGSPVATIALVCVSQNVGLSAVMSDSQSNSYTALTASVLNGSSQIFYKLNPSTSTSMTWTLTGTNIFAALQAVLLSGVAAFESQTTNQNAGVTTTVGYGSLTPAAINGLFLTCLHVEDVGTTTINAPPTLLLNSPFNSGTSYGGAMAYYFPTNTSAINGVWNNGAFNAQMASASALFTAGTPPTTIRRRVSVIQ